MRRRVRCCARATGRHESRVSDACRGILRRCALAPCTLCICGGETLPRLRVMRARVDPPVPGLRLDAVEGTELDARGAHEIAGRIRIQFQASGYPDAEVRAELHSTAPDKGDLSIRVMRGRSIEMSRAAFEGELGLAASELRKALNAAQARTPEAGVASLQSFYYQRSYFHAQVRAVAVEPHGKKLRVRFEVHSGPQHEGGFHPQAIRTTAYAGPRSTAAVVSSARSVARNSMIPAAPPGTARQTTRRTANSAAITRSVMRPSCGRYPWMRTRRSTRVCCTGRLGA